jgi:hypothetical protein
MTKPVTSRGRSPRPKKVPSPKVSKPNTSASRSQAHETSHVKKEFHSSDNWKKVVRDAPWVGGQSSDLNPGSTGAIGRRKNSSKFKARGKKVIRPRIQKHRKQTDKK